MTGGVVKNRCCNFTFPVLLVSIGIFRVALNSVCDDQKMSFEVRLNSLNV